MSNSIGILGGMGPRATVHFEQQLLRKCSGSDQEIPILITINDGKISDRSEFLVGIGKDPFQQLLHRALQLQSLEVEVIAIPCNSACAPQIIDRLQAFVSTPILNLPKIVTHRMKKNSASRVLILGTKGTILAGTYQKLMGFEKISYVVPSLQLQALIDQTISTVKLGQEISTELTRAVSCSIADIQPRSVVLACTELSIAKKSIVAGVEIFDTIDILADEVMEYTTNKERQYVTR